MRGMDDDLLNKVVEVLQEDGEGAKKAAEQIISQMSALDIVSWTISSVALVVAIIVKTTD